MQKKNFITKICTLFIFCMIFVLLSSGCGRITRIDANGDGFTAQNTETANDTDNTQIMDDTQTAPDFSVIDWDGNSVNLSDFFGKPTILNFWASWCGPCKREMPDFEEAYEEYRNDINFVMVNLTDDDSETIKGAKEFIEESGYAFPVYFDTESEAAITYGVSSIPVTFFIDAEGKLVAQGTGMLDKASIEQGIGMILP